MRPLKEVVLKVFHLTDPPKRTAAAFAVGVFIAFTPTLGLHTVTIFLVAPLFRLNFLALLAGALINNPWTMIPIYSASLWVGLKVVGSEGIPPIDWDELTLQTLFTQFRPYIFPFVIGTLLLGVLFAGISYLVMARLLTRLRERKAASFEAFRAPLPPQNPPPESRGR